MNKCIIIGLVFFSCIIIFIICKFIFIYFNNCYTELFTIDEYNYIHNTLLENLEKTIQIFKKHDIEYWADGGTLLGSVRESKIIDKDDDIDIGVIETDWNKLLDSIKNKNELYNNFEKNGLHLIENWGIIKILSKRKDNDYTKNKIFIDIFSIKEDNNKYVYSYKPHQDTWKNAWYHKNELFPLQKGNLNHLKINIPNKAEKYLKRVYGDCSKDKCWKIPTNEESYHESEINLSI